MPVFLNPAGEEVFSTKNPGVAFRDSQAARIYLGFAEASFEQEVTKSLEIASAVRKKQLGFTDQTIACQRGEFSNSVPEDAGYTRGIQIVIFDLTEEQSATRFKNEIVELGEKLAAGLGRRSVVAGMVKNGIPQRCMGISP